MTVIELIEQLEKIPESRVDEEIQIYVRGPVSGILDIKRLDLTGDTITIDSFFMREDLST